MKKNIALMLAVAAFFTLQASEDNLIRNPEFKEQKKNWYITGTPSFKDGIATVPLTNVRKNDPETVTASIAQTIPAIAPGKYEFTAYYKGEFRNLYVVMRGYTKDKKSVNIIAKWLGKKDFIKAGDKPGWNKFYFVGTVPANVVRVSLHIEPWGAKGASIQVTGIELAEAE
jgi:hypothetical protein